MDDVLTLLQVVLDDPSAGQIGITRWGPSVWTPMICVARRRRSAKSSANARSGHRSTGVSPLRNTGDHCD